MAFNWRHPLRSLAEIFTETPERTAPEPTPEPPIDFGPTEYIPGNEPNERQENVWDSITAYRGTDDDMQQFWEVFLDSGAPDDESQPRVTNLWEDFLRAFYLTTGESGHITRAEWYDMAGVNSGNIDWQAWREVKHSP